MANDDGRGSIPSSHSVPPVNETADMAWDDDTAPPLDHEESSDRVTAIPELPSEVFARQLMAEAVDEPVSGTFERGDDEFLRRDAPRGASTTPPRGPRLTVEEPKLEIDESALSSAVAARGRWQRPPEASDAPPQSLELDLSALERSTPPPDPAMVELADRYAMGDFSGALVVAEGILESDPGHAEALRFAKSCREVLTGMYSARLGSLDQVVTVGVPVDQIRWLSLDHRAGFLLSLVDGSSTLEEILDISGMPRLDALRIMFSLLQEGVIVLPSRG